ncbi:MAG: RdgB/HAM1 family non-canonical purine NTP pyrophosphatase [Methanoregulaceae archaeon]|nr:RdgB/HAM1 family non-canonical purine NTP pyrophosphatase [Methanoregulaceae archaeon]
MRLAIVTGNRHKADEIAAFFAGILETEHVGMDCPEYRDDDVGEITRQKAIFAFNTLRRPLIVDDTGFSVEALKGFPGPYAAYVQRTIGNEGILRLLSGVDNRRAFFETAIGYADDRGVRIFRGRIDGFIGGPRGDNGFGYDPIFETGGKTLAEMTLADKCHISHRARALESLLEWLRCEGLAYPVTKE